MTIQKIIEACESKEEYIWIYYSILFTINIISLIFQNKSNFNFFKYIFSTIIYLFTIPGILALITVLYLLMFQQQNILALNITTYYIPIIFMAINLYIINKRVPLSIIPGFKNIAGLISLISITCILIFILQRTYFGVLFLGSTTQLFVVFFMIFILIKYSFKRVFK